MKKVKIGLIVLLAGILLSTVSVMAEAAKDGSMNREELASILTDMLGIEMPTGSDELSDADFYKVQADILAERGITLFANGESNWKVNKCDLANVIYDALMGPNNATIQEKFDYLDGEGYMTSNSDYKCVVMTSEEVLAILNIPELSQAIAEAYSAPAIFGGGTGEPSGIAPAPENPESEGIIPTPETPASPIR